MRVCLSWFATALTAFALAGGAESDSADPSEGVGQPDGVSRMWTGAMLEVQEGWEPHGGDPYTWPGLTTKLSVGSAQREFRPYRLAVVPPLEPGSYSVFVYVTRGIGAASKCWVGAKFGETGRVKPSDVKLKEFDGSTWVHVGDAEAREPASRLTILCQAVPPAEPKQEDPDDLEEAELEEEDEEEIGVDVGAVMQTPKQAILLQGVYVTTQRDEAVSGLGLIDRSRPTLASPATPRKGNILENSSFEAGRTHGWGAAFGSPPPLWWVNMWDESVGYDGECSLRIRVPPSETGQYRTIENKMLSLPADRTYTLSVWAKADRPCGIHLGLRACPEDPEDPSHEPFWLQSQNQVGTDWMRFRATGVTGRSPGQLCHVWISIRAPAEGVKIWIDAAQLEEGEKPAAYRPRGPVEVGTVADVPGRILFRGEPSPVELAAYAPSKPKEPVTVVSRLYNYMNREVWSKKTTFRFTDRARVVVPLEVPTDRTGIFRLLNAIVGSAAPLDEQSLSVLPRPKALGSFDRKATLGADAHATRESVALLKRANFNWLINKHYGRWPNVEKERGKIDFFAEEAVKIAHEQGLGVIIQTLSVQWGGPEWIRPHAKPRLGAKDNSAPWPKEDRDKYCKAYGDYIYRLVGRYKPWVKHWEIDNEPGYQVRSDEYLEILKAAYTGAKKADPNCTVIGGSHYYTGWMTGWLANGGTEFCDEVSGHYYDSREAAHELWANRIVDRFKKVAWNSETGPTPGTWYLMLPEPWTTGISLADRAGRINRSSQISLDVVVKNYLISMSFGKFRHYLYYFMRFYNLSPSQPTRRGGSGKELCEFDGALRMAGAGLSIASHFLDGSELYGRWKKDLRVRCFLYAKDGGSVGFAWCNEGAPLIFSMPVEAATDVDWFDVMGAPIELDRKGDLATGRFTKLPCYFASELEPPELMVRLDQMSLSLPVEMLARFATAAGGQPVLRVALRNALDAPKPLRGTLSGPTFGHCRSRHRISMTVLEPGKSASVELPITTALPVGSVDFTFPLGDEQFTLNRSFYIAQAVRAARLPGDMRAFSGPRVSIPGRKGKVRYGAGNIFGNDWIRGEAMVWCDDDRLYLACNLTDAVVRPLKAGEREDQGDRAQFLLKTDAQRAPLSRTLTSDCFKVLLQLLEGGKARATLRRHDGSAEALPMAAAQVREKGYTVEAGIPWAKLGLDGPPASGSYWGFQCEIFNAASVGGGTDSEIVWSGSAETYDDPTDWGQLRFIGE